MDGEYVSMFKINGIPILPPLMTAARRREMLAYKELAIALENRLKLERKNRDESVQAEDLDSITTMEDEYLKVSSMLQDHFSPSKLPPCTPTARLNTPEVLKKSDTFIYDINTNTVMIPGDEKVVVPNTETHQFDKPHCSSNFGNLPQADSIRNPQEVGQINLKSPNILSKISKHVSPSISIQPPAPEIKNGACCDLAERPSTPVRRDSDSKPTQRASTSPALKQTSPVPKLVRSNSFTLECPSPVLLEHMVRNRLRNTDMSASLHCESPKADRDVSKRPKSKADGTAVSSTPQARILSSAPPKVNGTNTSTPVSEPGKPNAAPAANSTQFKNKKSPYDVKLVGKPKSTKRHKMPLKKISSVTLKPKLSISHHHRSKLIMGSPRNKPQVKRHNCEVTSENPPPTPASPVSHGNNADLVQEKIREIEEQHLLRLMALMNQQQEEQRRMQEEFTRQQQELLEEFNAGLRSLKALTLSLPQSNGEESKVSSKTPNGFSCINNQNSSMKGQVVLNEESELFDMTNTLATSPEPTKYTPRCSRRLFEGYGSPPTPRQQIRVVSPKSTPTTARGTSQIPSPSRRRPTKKQLPLDNLSWFQIEQAATTINAFARGYLVRRLFRTEHVQTIVKTIRDTLLFVLDFHRETEHDMSEENILFKARLLQQLTSASNSLGAVFDLPVKEKMLIIARDRTYVKNKSRVLNRSGAR